MEISSNLGQNQRTHNSLRRFPQLLFKYSLANDKITLFRFLVTKMRFIDFPYHTKIGIYVFLAATLEFLTMGVFWPF